VCVATARYDSLCVRRKKKFFGDLVSQAGQEYSEYFAKGVQSADTEERLSIRVSMSQGASRQSRIRSPVRSHGAASAYCRDHTILCGEVEEGNAGARRCFITREKGKIPPRRATLLEKLFFWNSYGGRIAGRRAEATRPNRPFLCEALHSRPQDIDRIVCTY